ncbi:hypothetical protein [Allorhizocola rhizosphaerae]|uniref:hypothetical protein n=1 Tax=Allorhizocola rhizosphaerae TaxID=1872709 RepID=UPI000E3D7395|nr:hypothetical protein [Allorhizocola rhizosphaerae]
MNTPLNRLYKTKLALLAWIALAVGAGLLLLAAWAPSVDSWAWIARLPVATIGETLLGIGLIAIIFEFISRQDAEERDNERLRTILREEAPAIRDAVVEGFAFTPESLTNVASPETLDRVVENCLALRLGDRTLAAEVYSDIRKQVVQAPTRCFDAKVGITLTPWSGGPKTGPGSMFEATIRWEYEVEPLTTPMRFSCVSNEQEYRELLQDPTSTTTWYFAPSSQLDAASPEVFELLHFSVDGHEQRIRRTSRKGAQVYTVQAGPELEAKNRHKVSYAFRVLVRREGRLLHLDIGRPTRGLNLQLSYGGCGIQAVKVVDHIASATRPQISRLPATAPTPSVSLAFDGWVWPRSGVGFVWTLSTHRKNNQRTEEHA